VEIQYLVRVQTLEQFHLKQRKCFWRSDTVKANTMFIMD